MPTIQFKGKNIIWNHHLSVPYHTLEELEELHYNPEKGEGNIIVEGDNLVALKALLPEYAGKVKCIYIDPPYNTGNEGWVYNDKVNSPLIKEWVGKTVSSDDLTRQDKWLCVMTPRLKLLKELLTNDGVILISIDDHEFGSLMQLMEEIFGKSGRLATFIWRRRVSSSMASSWVSTDHEYVLAFSLNPEEVWVYGEGRDMSKYNKEDKDGRKYASMPLTVGMNKDMRPNQWYELVDPYNGEHYLPSKNRVWGYIPSSMKAKIDDDMIIWPGAYPESRMTTPRLKSYPEDAKRDRKPVSTWIFENKTEVDTLERTILKVGKNEEGTRLINELLPDSNFQYSKPLSLIHNLIRQFSKDNDIILDSFSGSGTTMHAVNQLNKEDGGNRKCILVQMKEDSDAEPDKNICKDITRERNVRAIDKYEFDTGFKYYKVGTAIDPDKMLDGELPTYEEFAKYIYYLGTGEHLDKIDKIDPTTHFVGMHGPKAFFLIYEQDKDALSRMALNLHIAEDIVAQSMGKRRVVYAPACFLDKEYMDDKQIEFVSIPYNLFERK